ncbi:hypothetical protein [Antarcticimicrobium luteum]|nr:hypothetical protein [Antarcticimicrobium luteum]
MFAVGTAGLVLAIYFLARAGLARHVRDETRELAGSVVFRISALHGLIRALVFAQETVGRYNLEQETIHEASALTDLYFDIDRHGSDRREEMRAELRAYAETVYGAEWAQLGETGRLSGAAWGQWEKVYDIALDLQVDTPRQESLRSAMLADLEEIAKMRDNRESHGFSGNLVPFWFAAVSGVVLISFSYFFFSPLPLNLLLLSMFGAYTGIVLFLIYAFSNPFSAPGVLEPVAVERFLADTAPP